MNTKNYIDDILLELEAKIGIEYEKGSNDIEKIPTLEPNYYRPISPMLKVRFNILSHLLDATHGDWLSIKEMELLWDDDIQDTRIRDIKNNLIANIENWENNAGALFKKNRLSLFAGSAYTYEQIYLLWLDGFEEPQLWIYDTNGEARFIDLDDYLKSFIDDDVTVYEKSRWFSIQ